MSADTALRHKIYLLLDSSTEPTKQHIFLNVFLVLLIVINVIAVILESMPAIYRSYHQAFFLLEIVSSLIFTLEYLARVWTCVEDPSGRFSRPWGRLRYMLTPMAIVDALSFIPFYLSFIVDADLRIFRVLRLLRILKLSRYSSSIDIIASVWRQEASSFGITAILMLIVILLASGGIYAFEYQAQPDDFGSIPQAIWWSIATLTTVGYGDVTPITVEGKMFGTLVMIGGVAMVALPTGILSSAFSDELRRRRERFIREVNKATEDGVIDLEEQVELDLLQKNLGITKHDAMEIMHKAVRAMDRDATRNCPHCGNTLK